MTLLTPGKCSALSGDGGARDAEPRAALFNLLSRAFPRLRGIDLTRIPKRQSSGRARCQPNTITMPSPLSQNMPLSFSGARCCTEEDVPYSGPVEKFKANILEIRWNISQSE